MTASTTAPTPPAAPSLTAAPTLTAATTRTAAPTPIRARPPDERRHADAGGAAGRDRRGDRIAGPLGDRRVRPPPGRPPPLPGRCRADRALADRAGQYGRLLPAGDRGGHDRLGQRDR